MGRSIVGGFGRGAVPDEPGPSVPGASKRTGAAVASVPGRNPDGGSGRAGGDESRVPRGGSSMIRRRRNRRDRAANRGRQACSMPA